MGKSKPTTRQLAKAAAGKSKATRKLQARKTGGQPKKGHKRLASNGSEAAVSSDPEGPSARPKKKGKHANVSDEDEEKAEDSAELEEVELVEDDEPESEVDLVSSL